jgi:hypothetical protein
MARREADLERRLLAVHFAYLAGEHPLQEGGAERLQGLVFNLKLPDVVLISPLRGGRRR